MDRDGAKQTIERVLSLRKDGDLEVELVARTSSHTRFARNEITTSGFVEDVALTVAARREGRSGAVSTNDLSSEGLKQAVARAVELRDLMPVDPEWVETLPPQKYPTLEKYDREAERARAADRAPGVKAALTLADRRKLTAAGFFENSVERRAIANSKGNFGFHESSDVEFSVTMRTSDGTGSGWASAYSPRFSEVDPKSLARRAADKGVESAKPREVPPGDYTVILEPDAVAALVQTLQFGALSKRAADEGRGGGRGDAGRSDRRDGPGLSRHALWVHPPRHPAARAARGAHARGVVPDGEGKDHAPGRHPALQRDPGGYAAKHRGDAPRRSG